MNKKSKVFCVLPFIHTHVEPNGAVRACCIAQGEPFGNIQNSSIESIWNNEKYREFRLRMQKEEPSIECRRCMIEETYAKQSSRISMNDVYAGYDHLVDCMAPDGSLPHMDLQRWDFRFSNLCNLACMGCSPNCSSLWSDLRNDMFGQSATKFLRNDNQMESFLTTICEKSIDTVRQVYFAGGEPLIQWEHYEILERLMAKGRFDDDSLDVSYSTNLTSLNFKGKDIFEYWNKIKRLRVLVSIDEVDESRLYYIRYPSSLGKIVTNLRKLKDNLATADRTYSITPTWSLMNMHRAKEMMEFYIQQDLLPASFQTTPFWEHDFHLQIMLDPASMSVGAASNDWKRYLIDKINDYQHWYETTCIPMKTTAVQGHSLELFRTSIERFRSAVNRNVSYDRQQWLHWVSRLDSVRKTSWQSVLPELKWHIDPDCK